jgi:alpha-N-acetylglucosamine transferase
MLVFSFTEFRKVVWMDSDSFALKNLDHLMKLPAFSATALPACCHGIGPA